MRKEYSFQEGKRGAVISRRGETRITVYVDDGILARLRKRADAEGRSLQALINESLTQYLGTANF